MKWKKGYPPEDPRTSPDWSERWEIYFSPGGIVWHRRKSS